MGNFFKLQAFLVACANINQSLQREEIKRSRFLFLYIWLHLQHASAKYAQKKKKKTLYRCHTVTVVEEF